MNGYYHQCTKSHFLFTIIEEVREVFYDREYEDKKGYLMDFDLLFPHGYGEAISGAAREYDHRKVIPRMKESGESLGKYKWYLDFLQLQHGKPTAGFGFLERTVRYFCALPSIMMALPYPKIPQLQPVGKINYAN